MGGSTVVATDSDGCGDEALPDVGGFSSRLTLVNGNGLRE